MDQFERELTGLYPALRSFAIKLLRSQEGADDLIQETFLKALINRDSFTLGTNMRAWVFVIMRNHLYSEKVLLKNKPHSSLDDLGDALPDLWQEANQLQSVELRETLQMLASMSGVAQEAILLVGVEGRYYDEAAKLANVSIGTIKSRVSRARAQLERICASA